MIDSVIVALLQTNKRLVVPNFGAFIRKDETGEVVFVEFLKKDDGVLISTLERNYSLSQVAAIEQIERFIGAVRQGVSTSGSHLIVGLGVMHSGENSGFELDYNPNITAIAPKIVPPVVPKLVVAPTPLPLPTTPTPPVSIPTPAPPKPPKPTPPPVSAPTNFRPPTKKKRADMVMIFAIVAAVAAILVMVYGLTSEKPPKINITPPQTQSTPTSGGQ